ncbi:MAG: virulence factor BrkB family protein [Gammaproteobacteria bacterium]|nr:virulence factor BrkB family protein [Gammaproteobacteria bacterium]
MKYLKLAGRFFLFVWQRFFQQRCTETAASLSYTSLLSLVPLMAVFFAGFSSFSVFQDLFQQIQYFIFDNFVPSSSEVIQEYLNKFVGKASKLTLVGLLSLFVVALMLMWQIDKSLNQIWGVTKGKNFLRTFLTYWAVLTLGPVLIGVSLMVTSYITSLPFISGAADSIGIKTQMLSMIPVILTMVAFTLIYLVVPNTRVPFWHALSGGVAATILFEVAKRGFALYISHNSTYSSLYGALATLPIFLLWIYISWLVTLLGAVTTRAIALFDFSFANQSFENNEFLSVFHILRILSKAAQNGQSLSETQIHREPLLHYEKRLDGLMNKLENSGWIHKTEDEEWALTKDLDKITLWDLYQELPYPLPKSATGEPLSSIIGQTNNILAQELNGPVKTLFTHYDDS